MPNIKRIPILLLTGFLGSGKTTLLRALLGAPEAKDTAVVVNEIGEIGLDHHLLIGASERMFVLENGCVCCDLRDDLEASLEELFWGRLRRELPAFARVVVETTGLADPGGVLRLARDGSLAAERFEWSAIAATVDGVSGARTLERHPESVSQAAAADHLIVTKTDLADAAGLDALEDRLRILNPAAGMHRSARGALGATLAELMTPTRPETPLSRAAAEDAPSHLSDVSSVWLCFDAKVRRADLEAAFARLTDRFGADVLRAKGLVALADRDPAAVVQYVAGGPLAIENPPAALAADAPSGLVVIARSVPESAIAEIFQACGAAHILGHDSPHEHHHHTHAS